MKENACEVLVATIGKVAVEEKLKILTKLWKANVKAEVTFSIIVDDVRWESENWQTDKPRLQQWNTDDFMVGRGRTGEKANKIEDFI